MSMDAMEELGSEQPSKRPPRLRPGEIVVHNAKDTALSSTSRAEELYLELSELDGNERNGRLRALLAEDRSLGVEVAKLLKSGVKKKVETSFGVFDVGLYVTRMVNGVLQESLVEGLDMRDIQSRMGEVRERVRDELKGVNSVSVAKSKIDSVVYDVFGNVIREAS